MGLALPEATRRQLYEALAPEHQPSDVMRIARKIGALIDRPDHAVQEHTIKEIARIIAEESTYATA